MFTTPQKRGGASALFNTSSITLPLTKGLFSDGVWHCNCSPRLPATHFLVRKEGRNKGRWFYTCQTNKEDGGCGFFLWDEEAKTREGKTVMGNSRSEQEAQPTTPPRIHAYDGREDRDKVPLSGKSNATSAASAQVGGSEGSSEDFGEWPLSPHTESKVAQDTKIKYSSPPWPETQPETPRKSSKLSPFTTPRSKRKRDLDGNVANEKVAADALPTPITGGGRVRNASEYGYNDSDPFSTPSSLRTLSQFGIRSPSHTPTPQASHLQRPTSPLDLRLDSSHAISSNTYDVTSDVMILLQEGNVYLDEATEERLKSLLGKHAMRVSGIAKGRDITRVALRSKDAKIAELGLKIGQLETEREVDKRVIKSLVRDDRERG